VKFRTDLSVNQGQQVLYAISAYLNDVDAGRVTMSPRDYRALQNAEKALREARLHHMHKRLRAGLRA
jgi:hypothetical protein